MALLMVPGMEKQAAGAFIRENDLTDAASAEETPERIRAFARGDSRIKVLDKGTFERYLDQAEQALLDCEKQGIETISILDPEYPVKFRELKIPPVLLYLKGDRALLYGYRHIAVIGTREATEHGRRAGYRLGQILAEKGEVVVSGLAIGCDTSGHRGCIDAGGKTIAILPSPLDGILPEVNRGLADKILATGGLLLTEYRPGEKVRPDFYAERDRLQSGLSDGLIVVETEAAGGTMHTVRFAKEAGKVLACCRPPKELLGRPQTEGNEMLIAGGDAMPLGKEDEIRAFLDAVTDYRSKVREGRERRPE